VKRVAGETDYFTPAIQPAQLGLARASNAAMRARRSLTNLEILAADERTLFAMKCAAARTQEDAADIRLLAERLAVRSSAEALEVVLRYYPEERLPVRTRPLLEELLDDRS
jgi:hypothetical protein